MLKDKLIPTQAAIQKTANWRLYNTQLDPHDTQYIKAFHIPKEDIDELSKIPDAIGFRAYLAMEDSLERSTTHLLLVSIFKRASDGKEVDRTSAVYDFTTPCPDSCDHESALFRGLEQVS